MLHYKNGTEIQVGQYAFGPSHGSSKPLAGIVLRIDPKATDSNVTLSIAELGPNGAPRLLEQVCDADQLTPIAAKS